MYMFFLSKTQPIQNGEDLLSDDESTVSSEGIDVKTQFRVISETVVIEDKQVLTPKLVSEDSLLKTEHVTVTVANDATKSSVLSDTLATKFSVISETVVPETVVPETVVPETVVPETVVEGKGDSAPSETAQVSLPPVEENKNRWYLARFMCWRQ